MFKISSLFGLLCVALLFQNCSDPLTQFKSHGNGDPYEGLSDPPDNGGVNPGNGGQYPLPDEEGREVQEVPVNFIDPDQGADTEIERGCFATDPVIHQLWTIQDHRALKSYLILQFEDRQGFTREKAIHWSNTADLMERSVVWTLDGGTEVSHITFSAGKALLTYKRNGVLFEAELQCSP